MIEIQSPGVLMRLLHFHSDFGIIITTTALDLLERLHVCCFFHAVFSFTSLMTNETGKKKMENLSNDKSSESSRVKGYSQAALIICSARGSCICRVHFSGQLVGSHAVFVCLQPNP